MLQKSLGNFMYIQVHLKEDLNDTYRGEIDFKGGKEMHAQIKPYKISSQEGKQQDVISNI